MIDGAPIVAVATGLHGDSSNPKTGGMVQVWILPDAGVSPSQGFATDQDASVCGDCVHRGATDASGHRRGRVCYVNMFGPDSVWRTLQAGKYGDVTPREASEILAGRRVRLGAWGDPAAVPFDVMSTVVARAAGRTGYTHQWRVCDPRWAGLVMASADSVEDYRRARAIGYRAFVVMPAGTTELAGAIQCVEATRGTQCIDCLACDGTKNGTRPNAVSVWIHAHGIGAGMFNRQALQHAS